MREKLRKNLRARWNVIVANTDVRTIRRMIVVKGYRGIDDGRQVITMDYFLIEYRGARYRKEIRLKNDIELVQRHDQTRSFIDVDEEETSLLPRNVKKFTYDVERGSP